MTEQELDELYKEVKENRKRLKKEISDIAAERVREDVEKILKLFKSVKDSKERVECVKIELDGSYKSWPGRWTLDEQPTVHKMIAKKSKEEKKYLESLLNRYCDIVKVDEYNWKLTLK